MRQQHIIECGRCGKVELEYLTEEEAISLNNVAISVYRQCEQCGKITDWINSTHTPLTQTIENRTPSGQERMATSAERDEVNARLHSSM